MLTAPLKLSFSEEKIQKVIILKVLQQIHYYLMIGQDRFSNSNVPNFKSNSKTKKILNNLLDFEDYRMLLSKEDVLVTNEILNISFELCSNYLVYPNYQVVKYILTKIITKDNLLEYVKEKRDNSEENQ